MRNGSLWKVVPSVLTTANLFCGFYGIIAALREEFYQAAIAILVAVVFDGLDGKVARLTLTDSKIGNVLDHGLDQVHPPFWYFAWAWGLGARTPDDTLYMAAVWLIVFYVADRLILAVAKRRLGYALHAATRLDTLARAVIARRNITMTIMAIGLLVGAGPAAFIIVTAWQALTFAWHTFRTVWLGFVAPAAARVKPR